LADLGAREKQVAVLDRIINGLPAPNSSLILESPFLPVCPRFEQIEAWDLLLDWFAAAALEQLELSCEFSSYYTRESAITRLEVIRKLGFQSAEMERRRQLVRMRLRKQNGPFPSPLLAKQSELNRNPDYWLRVSH
jgi:hypothetical protein